MRKAFSRRQRVFVFLLGNISSRKKQHSLFYSARKTSSNKEKIVEDLLLVFIEVRLAVVKKPTFFFSFRLCKDKHLQQKGVAKK